MVVTLEPEFDPQDPHVRRKEPTSTNLSSDPHTNAMPHTQVCTSTHTKQINVKKKKQKQNHKAQRREFMNLNTLQLKILKNNLSIYVKEYYVVFLKNKTASNKMIKF